MKPCEPTKMAKEDLFLASGRSNNEYLGSVIRLFQTVSLGDSVNRGNPPLDSFVICGHCHSRSTLVRLIVGKGEA
jgi:hypothetical protein